MKDLLSQLGYSQSAHHKLIDDWHEPETAHLSNLASNAGVKSVYLLETSPTEPDIAPLPARPLVYVAEANTVEQARQIHQKIWNLNSTPFLIIILPAEVRVYTGFSYSAEDIEVGLLERVKEESLQQVATLLEDISADSIDSGHIWQTELGKRVQVEQRVDRRLLRNLHTLEQILQDEELPRSTIHALIGKYIYLLYLRDRDILSDQWLAEHNLSSDQLFTYQATIQSLQRVITTLETRFNGRIFPLDFDAARQAGLTDKHISWVASIFRGSEFLDDTPDHILQLHLPFQAYNFYYIPVETLSAIYEQFIEEPKEKGAVYTPEYLADYVLSEVESVRAIEPGGKILDPACGSGVFLVLVYRRLIEKQIEKQGRLLTAEELKQLLLGSIYGVEREQEACYITEFSLILTLLHYIDPPDLHNLPNFKFPDLFNERIFHTDFFDTTAEAYESDFWSQGLQFDWIVGNPPWTSGIKKETDPWARQWIEQNRASYPVADYRVAEAFSWLTRELLTDGGIIGFLLPATSLFNKKSGKYREKFFQTNLIHKITNFANMREILFGKKNVLPAISVIYETVAEVPADHHLIHYAPFVINQTIQDYQQPWTLTINASEISTIRQTDVMDGYDVTVWKLALWGTIADQSLLEKIGWNFPTALNSLAEQYQWVFNQASELRDKNSADELIHKPELIGVAKLDKKILNQLPHKYSPQLDKMPQIDHDTCYIRKQGGERGVETTWQPHLFISARADDTILYSEEDFVIPTRNIGISASENPATAPALKALATYLNSSIVSYWVFFHVPQWGIFQQASRRITTGTIKKVPVPNFNDEQIQRLAAHYDKLVQREKETIRQLCLQVYQARGQELIRHDDILQEVIDFSSLSDDEKSEVSNAVEEKQREWQKELDQLVYHISGIPADMQTTISDFLQIRLHLDNWSTNDPATRRPSQFELQQYGERLQTELDQFVMGRANHLIQITVSKDLIECMVESRLPDNKDRLNIPPTNGKHRPQSDSYPPAVSLEKYEINIVDRAGLSKRKLLATFNQQLREQVSQWAYVKRNLRIYEENRIYIYKSPRLIDWTRTQASLDAQDIISHILTSKHVTHEA